ncbi:MAG TPA: Ig-like domain-containing protein [Mycobacterium sp.]|nr:Ig-like domain-containing protein [Mycobacterium sp.]
MAKLTVNPVSAGRHRVERGGSRPCTVASGNTTYARYIGRVGALAVALGVGLAVATGSGMGIARADESPSADSPSADSPSVKSEPTPETQSGGQPGDLNPSTPPSAVSTPESTSGEPPSAPTNEPSVPEMNYDSSGGAQTSGDDADGETKTVSTPRSTTASGATQTPAARPKSPKKNDNSARASEPSVTAKADSSQTVSPGDATTTDTTAKPVTSATVVGEPAEARVAPAPNGEIAMIDAQHTAAASTMQVSALSAPQRSTATPAVVEVNTSLLATALAPFAIPDPDAPTDAPALLTMLAWARRENQRTSVAEVPDVAPQETTLVLDTVSEPLALKTAAPAAKTQPAGSKPPRNTAPVATADRYTTTKGTPLTVTVPGVLANDTDAEANALTAQLAGKPANGTVTLRTDGSFTYSPNANFIGTDTFSYKASDGTTTSKPTKVTITVTGAVNRPPVAGNDSYSTNEDTPLTVATPGVLANDSDPDGNPITAQVVSNPSHGTLTLNSNGSFTYNPAANYNGPDSFTYRTNDGATNSNTATVSLTINSVNDAPTLTLPPAGTLTPDANGGVEFSVGGTDPEGSPITFSANTTQGSITQVTPTSFRYTPGDYAHLLAADGYSGPHTATITVTATDSAGGTTTSAFTVPVTPTNAGPTATGPAKTGTANPVNGAVPISFPVIDADQDTLKFTDDTDLGDLAIANGQLVFVPTEAARHAAVADTATAADREVTFTLTANDGHGGTTSTLVTVNIATSGVISSVTVPGNAAGGLRYTPDGTRAILTTQTAVYDAETQTYTTATRVAVIDTATGKQVGTTTTMEGLPTNSYYEGYLPAMISADGTRASQVTSTTTYDSTTSTYTYTTRVAIVDTATGTQVGDTITLAGSHNGTQYSADGTRLVQTTAGPTFDSATGTYTSTVRVTVIDTATGTQVGPGTTLAGQYGSTQLRGDGTAKLTAQSSTYDSSTSTSTYTTRVAVIDLRTGNQVGDVTTTTVSQSGSSGGSSLSTPDGTRIVRTTSERTYDQATYSYIDTTRVVVIDTATGEQVGTTVTLAGPGSSSLSADGTRAAVTTSEQRYDQPTYSYVYTTRVAIIDTASGEQIGTTVTLNGSGATQFIADGTRAVVTTSSETTYDPYTYTHTYTTRVVVLDTANAEQVGTTTTLTGSSTWLKVSADGTRAVATSLEETYDWIDGVNTYTSRAAIIDTAAGTQIGTTTALRGYGYSNDVQLNADGTRALFITDMYDSTPGVYSHTSRVAVIDVTTGEQIGTAITVSGSSGQAQFFADGTRAILTSQEEIYVDGQRTYTYTTRVTVVDVTTGNQIGSTVTMGGSPGGTLLNADETRLIQITTDRDEIFNGYTTRITMIDTATGDQVGTVTVRGEIDRYDYNYTRNPAPFTPDGARLVVTTSDQYSGGAATRVVFVDVATGTQVGTATTLAGNANSNIQFSADGTRAVQTTYAYTYANGSSTVLSTQVAVIDVATGTQVGPTTVLSGYSGGTVLSADGTRAFQTAYVYGNGTDSTTRLAVIDLATGNQVGVSAALPGYPTGTARLSADGTRVTLTTISSAGTKVTVIDIDQAGSNERPTVAAETESNDPDANGTVTGAVYFIDPDSDTLSYAGTGATLKGSVIVNADGSFVYTPTEAARLAAAKVSASPDAKQDTFTITAYDAHGGATPTVVTVAVLPKNTAPVATSTPGDFSNGVLTGTINGTDVDGDPLTYSVATQGGKGTVAVNPTTGAFTYTPSADARNAASATPNDVDTDTFTVTVDDGRGGSVTNTVTVDVPQTGVVADGPVDLPGSGALQYSPDGSRAIRVTSVQVRVGDYYDYDYVDRTSIAVIDTATGAQIGETVTIDGTSYNSALRYSADGAYASQIAVVSRGDYYNTVYSTRVAIIDTATGAVTVTELAGSPSSTMTFTADGGYAIQTATASRYRYVNGSYTYTYASEVAIIDTATGDVIKVQLPSAVSGFETDGSGALDATGTRAIFRTYRDGSNGALFVDTATGAVTEFSVPGYPYMQISDDHSRLVVQSYQAAGTQYTVVDTATGLQVGSTFDFAAAQSAGYSSNGSQIVVLQQDSSSGTTVTRLTAIDLTDGTQIGSTLTIAGAAYQIQYTDDGSRALVLGSGNGTVTVIDTSSFTTLGTISNLGQYVSDVQFSADGHHAVLLGRAGDYYSGYTTKVAIVDTTTGAQLGATLDVAGSAQAQFNSDGTRVMLTTSGTDTRVTVLDAATGALVGSTVTVTGSGQVLLNPAGTRATITISTYSSGTASYTSRVAIVDLTTGTQLGSTIELGAAYTDSRFSPDGNVVALTTREGDYVTGYTTHMTLVDVATGTQMGTTITQAGVGDVKFTADGNRVAVYTDTSGYGGQDKAITITVLDTSSGTQVGSTITVTGQSRGITSTPDRTRLLVTSFSDETGVTSLVVVDVTTGTQIGETVTLPGTAYYYNVTFNADGTRAVLNTYDNNNDNIHRVEVVDTVTGATQTYALRGEWQGSRFTSDGTRLIVDTLDNTAQGVAINRTSIIELT